MPGGVEDRRRRQPAEEVHGREDAAALLRDEHRVERAQTGAAVLFGDQQSGPAGLGRRGPEVREVGALERFPSGLHRLEARERAARRLAQELLLVAEREVHAVVASLSLARSSLNGIPLSRRGSGGSPSTRSPTVLRRISSVPPADFSPGRYEVISAHSLASTHAPGPNTSTMRPPASIAARTVVIFARPDSGPGI